MKKDIALSEIKSLDSGVLRQLSELLVHVVADGASVGFLPPLSLQEAAAYWEQVLSPGVLLWTAVEEQRIVGTVQLHLAMKANGSHRAEIAKLLVHPEHRRQGIARRLMQCAEEAAESEGRSLLILDTRAGDPSNDLYKSTGYTEAGRIPEYARSSNGELHATVFYYKMLGRSVDNLPFD